MKKRRKQERKKTEKETKELEREWEYGGLRVTISEQMLTRE